MAPKDPEPEEAEEPPEPEEGSGSFVFADGSKYEGSWLKKDGVTFRQGRGVYVDGASDAQRYEGEWADDMMQGRGTFTYASGAKYEGEFNANKYHGFGSFTFPDGSVYEAISRTT
jgi:hypothetical protein